MILNKEDILVLDQRYRTSFINSIAGFRQAVLVGTKSADGKTNLAIFNSLIHLGSNPALFGLISRPETVTRDTLRNILDTKEYTLNYIKSSHYEKAHQTSARYETGISEFEKAGFKEMYHPICGAPFAEDAVVKIAMKFEQRIDIRINGTVLIIGSVVQIEIDDSLVEPDGFVSLSEAEILISQGLDAYFVAKTVGRLPYAKPTV
ncbi:MAG TPA: flavin reductase [Ignavibacteria bacterium]|nr:flavin reductase [Ignavibacteria bacterium]HMR41736.1 flavin reductase [Ignavibacteria bacterium]